MCRLLCSKYRQFQIICPPPPPPPQPALSAYQCHLHHDIHGPDEPLPEPLAKRQKGGSVDPIKTRTTSPLPQLPGELLQKQKSLAELRDISPKPTETLFVHPPTTQLDDTQRTRFSVRPSPKRKDRASGVLRKKSSTLLLNSDPNTVLTRYSPPLESLTDPLEIVKRLRREPELGFLYLSPVNDFKSVKYNPYNLR